MHEQQNPSHTCWSRRRNGIFQQKHEEHDGDIVIGIGVERKEIIKCETFLLNWGRVCGQMKNRLNQKEAEGHDFGK